MANGLVSAARYGGPSEAIVEDPNATPLPQPSSEIPVEEEPQQVYVPTPAEVAPQPDRNLAEENNWMKDLQDYATQKYPDENEREKFIERASKYTRNNIAIARSSNRLMMQNDMDQVDKVLFNYDKFGGRGPRNDYEAAQINPAWPAMRQLALDHNQGPMQKHIDGAFSHNNKMDVPETSERRSRFEQAYGLIQGALQGQPDIDKWEVLNKVDPAQLDLSKRQVGILRHELSSLKSQKEIDNQMAHYTQVAGGLLNEAHIASNNDRLMNQFKGALAYELKQFQRTRKDPEAPIDDNDVLRITAGLIRDRSTGISQYNPFADPDRAFMVPQGWFTEENRQQFVNRFHREPIPEDIYRLYHTYKANQAQ